MAPPAHAILPELIWVDQGFRRGAALVVDGLGGIHSIGAVPAGLPVERLPGRALFPGLVNAHSHAFQRVLRGRTEGSTGDRDDFWSWRAQMYRAANALSPEALRAVSRQCYLEMLLAGITTVGEFHYLHRDPQGAPYADPNELGLQIVGAAEEVGLRIALLRVAYHRAGAGLPAEPLQRRFCDGSPELFLAACDALDRSLAGRPLASWGIAPHSVRALPREWFGPLRDFAAAHHRPVHMHLAEQPREILSCEAEHGLRPVELALEEGLLDERFTAVHGIHLSDLEIRALGEAGAAVCACPTTERNLGDGVVPAPELLEAGVRLALGTDGQSDVNLLEDARELEYHLRISRLSRAVLAPAGGGSQAFARELLACATEEGATTLGLPVGRLEAGRPADFFTVDLEDPSIAGAGEEDLLACVVFGLSRRAIREVAVAGRVVVRDGRHAEQSRIVRDFARVQEALWRS